MHERRRHQPFQLIQVEHRVRVEADVAERDAVWERKHRDVRGDDRESTRGYLPVRVEYPRERLGADEEGVDELWGLGGFVQGLSPGKPRAGEVSPADGGVESRAGDAALGGVGE